MNNPFESIEARLNNIETLLLDLKHNPLEQSTQTEKDELLTVQDAAKFLSLSVPTIYGLISKGNIPMMKRSKRCYFSKVELINYLKQGRKKTIAETAAEADQYLRNKRKGKYDGTY
jgi:excisionase family DNA binding protein